MNLDADLITRIITVRIIREKLFKDMKYFDSYSSKSSQPGYLSYYCLIKVQLSLKLTAKFHLDWTTNIF